ncbi:MAG TPA: hypothetical protein VF626_04235 [Chthoniobacterales bacterium]|jgi:hypothetical protein
MLTRITPNNSTKERFKRDVLPNDLPPDVAQFWDSPDVQAMLGGAQFTLKVASQPIASCFVCWGRNSSQTCWRAAEKTFFNLSEMHIQLDEGSEFMERPRTPWVTTLLMPQFQRLPSEQQRVIRALEVETAWQLIERNMP